MQDQLVITGKYLGASATESKGQNGLTVRRFWIDTTTNPEWPNTPEFQLKGDRVALVDNLSVGQVVQVKFNLDGRKYNNPATGRAGVITNLNAWKIEIVQVQSAVLARPAPAHPAGGPAPQAAPTMSGPGAYAAPQPASNDDLPF